MVINRAEMLEFVMKCVMTEDRGAWREDTHRWNTLGALPDHFLLAEREIPGTRHAETLNHSL